MKSIASLVVFLIISSFSFAGTDTASYAAFFDTDKHLLTIEEQQRMRQWLGRLGAGEYIFTLHGHTDVRGSYAYNQSLSERRVEQVAGFLQKEGVASAVIATAAFGEKLPVSLATSAADHQKNRRVYVVAQPLVFRSIADLDSLLMRQTEKVYSIDPSKAHTLTGNFGTTVQIPSNAFAVATNEDVQVTVREAVKVEHLMSLGLSTQTANGILETGGMMHIEVQDKNGKTLALMPDATIDIAFPTSSVKPEMQLYTSVANGTSWEQPVTVGEISFQEFFPEPDLVSTYGALGSGFHQKTIYKPLPEPIKPSPPMRPSKPRSVDEIRYVKEVKWYHLNKNQRRMENARALLLAERHVDTRELRYQRSMVAYEKAMLEYSRAVDAYHMDLREWTKKGGVESVTKKIRTKSAHINNQDFSKLYNLELQAAKHYNAQLAKQRAAYYDEHGGASFEDVKNYVLSTNTLGWINCDRIPQEFTGEKRPILAHTHDNRSKRVLLIFDEYDVMMNFNMDADVREIYHVANIPSDANISIFSYKVTEGRPQIAYQQGIVGDEVSLEYRNSSFAEIASLLSEM